MIQRFTILGSIIAMAFLWPVPAHAASEDECAIWLCLPAGFPEGCDNAYRAMIKRVKKRKPPLPNLSTCAAGSSGNYELGHEIYMPCEDGYILKETHQNEQLITAQCYRQDCAPKQYQRINHYCPSYNAIKREKPHFVKMWVNEDFLGQFFY